MKIKEFLKYLPKIREELGPIGDNWGLDIYGPNSKIILYFSNEDDFLLFKLKI